MALQENGAEEDWQVNCPKVQKRTKYLYSSKEWADCTFTFDSPTEPSTSAGSVSISAHKLILAMASPVFAAQFYGGLVEENPVLIRDIDRGTFTTMLRYIYTDEIDIKDLQEAMDLYYVAKKYFLPNLQQETIDTICRELNANNVCRVFEFSRFHDEAKLYEKCERIITKKTLDVFVSKSFLEVKRDTVKEIISFESLNILSELDLFNALVRYADHRRKDVVFGNNSVKTMPQLQVKLTRIGDAPRNSDMSDSSVSENEGQTSAVVSHKKTANGIKVLIPRDSFDKRNCRLGGRKSVNFQPDTSSKKSEALRILERLLSFYAPAHKTAANDFDVDTPEGTPEEDTSCQLAQETAANEPEVNSPKADFVRRLMRPCVQQVRFLTLTPREFAECRRLPTLLTDPEIMAVSLNIASKETAVRMPEEFSKSLLPRNQHHGNIPATIRFTIKNMAQVKKYTSEIFIARKIPWQVTVHLQTKRKSNCGKKLNYLKVFVDCLLQKEGEWACATHYAIRTIFSVVYDNECFDLPLERQEFSFTNENTRATHTYTWERPCGRNVPSEPLGINNSVTFEVRVEPGKLITSGTNVSGNRDCDNRDAPSVLLDESSSSDSSDSSTSSSNSSTSSSSSISSTSSSSRSSD